MCELDGTCENINAIICHVIEQSIPANSNCSVDGDWARTEINKTVELACSSRYSGKNTKFCKGDDTWEAINDS